MGGEVVDGWLCGCWVAVWLVCGEVVAGWRCSWWVARWLMGGGVVAGWRCGWCVARWLLGGGVVDGWRCGWCVARKDRRCDRQTDASDFRRVSQSWESLTEKRIFLTDINLAA